MAKQNRNPFKGAKDTYITKNKIAVTKTVNRSTARGFTQTKQTKYYVKSDANLRLLKKARPDGIVRVGRSGNRYTQL